MPEILYTTDAEKLEVAKQAAFAGLESGGIPIGAALFDADGRLLGSGHNLRVQENNPAIHGETAAFIDAGRQTNYRSTTMVTTLSPCWYCSGLIRQFSIGRLIVGDVTNFFGGQEWLAEQGVEVVTAEDAEMVRVMGDFIAANPELWNEDIGE